MTDPTTDTLETILQQCAAAAPHPWYPRGFAEANGVPPGAVDTALDRLRLRGLVRLTEWEAGRGQGYALTPHGEQVLHNPRLLGQLRSGDIPAASPAADREPGRPNRPATTYERGETIREALLAPGNPVVTKVLIGLNVLVFVAGLALAARQKIPLQLFLYGSHPDILDATGALRVIDLAQGQWWRLLTACFVHIGLLHLGMNMYSLWVLGPLLEKMWGHVRFLAIYLIAGLGGSCAMAYSLLDAPGVPGAGASGALWGLMTALAAWIILNRRFMPPALVSTWLRQIGWVFLLNVFISFLPGISAAGHFGGGATGLVVAVLLNFERFTAGWRRGLALAATALVPVLCVGALLRSQQVDPRWRGLDKVARDVEQEAQEEQEKREIRTFNKPVLSRFQELLRDAWGAYQKQVTPVIERAPTRRDPAAVENALTVLTDGKPKLREAEEVMAKAGPYTFPIVVKAQQASKDYAGELLKLFDVSEDYLKKGDKKDDKDEEALRDQQERVAEAEKRWHDSLRGK
jgi:membrane associated rhomboid family serine protease